MMKIRTPVLLLIAIMTLTPIAALTGLAMQPKQVSWPAIELSLIDDGYDSPVHITNAGDGSGRLFIVEQPGQIEIPGVGTFLDITNRVRNVGSEEGLLSVAFPPDFATSKYFYVYFTDDRAGNQGNNVLARFRVSEGDPNSADPDSEQILITFEHPDQSNHNGGQLFFGPDNYLYIGTGDGGGGGDPYENAQDLGSYLGKILRIDVGATSGIPPTPAPFNLYLPLIASDTNGPLYGIPSDNPFVGDPDALDEIWAYGMRNPWRFSFDRTSGDLWIGDVGQGSWEEIDFQPSASSGGENYGWDCREGMHDYEFDSTCIGLSFTEPVAEYDHTLGCSITGGFVYRGSDYPELQGIYLYADYCSGQIWGLQQDGENWVNQGLVNAGFGVTSFGEDESGELYLVRSNGDIYKIVEPIP
ncbi:MAG: PQQ-dependent sugar dehydrogenase [Anaerolineales bacterium]|jgi:glucose/arabinose dehydrogenase